jgi:hypothetical protein
MNHESISYSPHVLIYLEIGSSKIRLADVLFDTATLYEKVIAPLNTKANLVFSIDGVEDREEIVLTNGISEADSDIKFIYADPNRPNGRHFTA